MNYQSLIIASDRVLIFTAVDYCILKKTFHKIKYGFKLMTDFPYELVTTEKWSPGD